jgi:hypothetical protein
MIKWVDSNNKRLKTNKIMLTIFTILYNILRINKSKIEWLNLDNEEGVTTALVSLVIDALFLCVITTL